MGNFFNFISKLCLLSAYESCYLVELAESDRVLSAFLFHHKWARLVTHWLRTCLVY